MYTQEGEESEDWYEVCEQFRIEVGESSCENTHKNVDTDSESGGDDSAREEKSEGKVKKFSRKTVPHTVESSSEDGNHGRKSVRKRKRQKIVSAENVAMIGSDRDLESESEETGEPKRKVYRRKRIISSESEEKEEQKRKVMKRVRIISSDTTSETDSQMTQKPIYVPGNSVQFACSECNFTAKSSGKVHVHMVDNHNILLLVCEYCKFTTKNSTSMYNHKTKYCQKIGKDKKQQNMKTEEMKTPTHVHTTRGQSQRYKCKYCSFVAGSSGAVYKHMSDKHNMEKFLCTYCNFSTGNKTSMYNHKTRYCRKLKEKKDV